MTPVQLPEVPAIARFNVTGDYCYPTVDDPEGTCVSYDDHVAQLREYATITAQPYLRVLAEARRAIGDHIAPEHCYATGPMTGDPYRDLVECPACSFIAMYDALLTTPSETNSER